MYYKKKKPLLKILIGTIYGAMNPDIKIQETLPLYTPPIYDKKQIRYLVLFLQLDISYKLI